MGDFERLNSLVSEVADDIAQRKRLTPATNPAHQQQHSKLTATIQRKLKQLEAEISMKDEELRSGKSRNQRDYHQKSGMLAVLSLRREELLEEFQKDGGTVPADEGNQGVIAQLFGPKKTEAQKQQAANREQLMSMDVEALKEKKERLFQDQDKGIDMLSDTVGRQMNVAKSIGKEVSRHHIILDSLETKVGDTDNRVRRETLRVTEFTEDTSSLCPYYCFILVLIVVIVVLLSLPSDLI